MGSEGADETSGRRVAINEGRIGGCLEPSESVASTRDLSAAIVVPATNAGPLDTVRLETGPEVEAMVGAPSLVMSFMAPDARVSWLTERFF